MPLSPAPSTYIALGAWFKCSEGGIAKIMPDKDAALYASCGVALHLAELARCMQGLGHAHGRPIVLGVNLRAVAAQK